MCAGAITYRVSDARPEEIGNLALAGTSVDGIAAAWYVITAIRNATLEPRQARSSTLDPLKASKPER